MTYREYMNGAPLICSVAPTGYRPLDGHGAAVPISPEAVADDVEACRLAGASIAQLHGRRPDGEPAPSRLPAVGSAVRELGTDILVEYATGPTAQLGDYLDVVDEGEPPDLAQVYLGPFQSGRRDVATITRHDVERFVRALRERGVKPDLLVSSGRDLTELSRLRQAGALGPEPMVTIRLGGPDGTVATPHELLALLEAVPDSATVLVAAAGPNQFPLTTIALCMGAHVRTGMGDNLYLDRERPVQHNGQLVERLGDVVAYSRRRFADPAEVTEHLSLNRVGPDRGQTEH